MTDWPTVRLKYLSSERVAAGVGEAAEFDRRDWPRYIRTTDIATPRALHEHTFKSLPPHIASKAPARADDLLMTSAGSVGTTVLVPEDVGPACYAGYLVRVRPNDRVDPTFLAYWTESRSFQHAVVSGAVQSTIMNFSASKYAGLRLHLPLLPTQRKIASFLDRETGRIDALIDKKRRLIDLLEEKRTATITHAVTKGLDPTAPTKDSGIPRIGEVPASWRVAPIRRIAAFRNSNVDKKVVDGETPVLLCNYTDVYYGNYLDSTEGFMPASATTDEILRFQLKKDTVIITKDSESADDIGVPAYIAAQLDAVCGYHLTVLQPVQSLVTGEFLYWVLESTSLRQAFEVHAQGVTRFGLTRDGIGSPAIPVPGIPEQQTIVDQLRALDHHVRELTQRIQSQLTLLAEYREALITAAVTGEIDVDTFDGEQTTERTAS